MKVVIWITLMIPFTLSSLNLCGSAWAQTKTESASKTTDKPKMGGNRSKSLSFDDSVVEGMNRNPLDSIESVGKEDTSKQPHLYNKRLHFRKELKDSLRESGYQP